LTFERLKLAVVFVAIFGLAALLPAQADTFWHLRAGQLFWQTGRVPMVETFSHTHPGRFWPNHEWAWQAVSYGLWKLGGFPVLSSFAAIVIAGAHAFSLRLMDTTASRRMLLLVLAVPMSSAVWALRPQVVSLLCLALLLWLLVRKRFLFVPPLFVVWANFHGAVALGGIILAAVTAVSLWRFRREARALLPVLILAGMATAATPMGTRLWSFVGASIGRSTEVRIMEWTPVAPWSVPGVWFYATTAALVAFALHRQPWRRLRSFEDAVLVTAAVILLPLAARYARNIPPFFLAAAPLAARLWGHPADPPRATPDRLRLNLAVFAGATAAMCAVVGHMWFHRGEILGWYPISPPALAALRACPGRLYNHYDDGGYLIWFAPERPVYLDSRQDPYPHDFVATATREERRGLDAQSLAARGITCAFVAPQSPTTAKLVAGGWNLRHRDESWVVLERNPAR
jgi:hypothetical protein